MLESLNAAVLILGLFDAVVWLFSVSSFCGHADHTNRKNMTPAGFEPAQLALVELESTPLDHSGKVSMSLCHAKKFLAYDHPEYCKMTS
jgi:hypothetical protein